MSWFYVHRFWFYGTESTVLGLSYTSLECVSSTPLAEVGVSDLYPFHSPESSSTHKFLTRLDVHITFVRVLTAVGF